VDSTTSIKLLDERTIFMFAFRICFIRRDLVILFQQNVTSAEFEKFEAQTFARKAKNLRSGSRRKWARKKLYTEQTFGQSVSHQTKTGVLNLTGGA